MKRFSTLLNRKKGSPSDSQSPPTATSSTADGDEPTAAAARAVRLFCESGSQTNRDEELLHLPAIVEPAEGSPKAAAACAVQIRDFLHKSYKGKPHVQYNAIMLVRILSDNPGATFTKNFDDKFVKNVKTLLRESRDANVQQILRETLDHLEVHRASDVGVQGLVQMWRREKGKAASLKASDRTTFSPAGAEHFSVARGQGHASGTGRSRSTGLPPPAELSSRIEEARNTAKILIQFLQTTPSEELFTNDLIKEFSDRCQSAQRSMQGFINCDDPTPDDNTLQTLIETHEQLSLANSRYQRAVLAARRALGTASPAADPSGITPVNSQPAIQPQQETGLLSASSRPQQNGFGIFGGATTNGNTYGGSTTGTQPTTSVYPPATTQQAPPQQPIAPVNPQVQAVQNDDYDDLYDSPTVNRAPAAVNPFADPVDHPTSAQSGSSRPGNFANASSIEPAKPFDAASSNYSPAPDSAITQETSPTARPSAGPWHNSTVTESFLGRQNNAAEGVTMHAPTSVQRHELDHQPNVGRS